MNEHRKSLSSGSEWTMVCHALHASVEYAPAYLKNALTDEAVKFLSTASVMYGASREESVSVRANLEVCSKRTS